MVAPLGKGEGGLGWRQVGVGRGGWLRRVGRGAGSLVKAGWEKVARWDRDSEEQEGDQDLKFSFPAFAAGHTVGPKHWKWTSLGAY